jgi:methylase of polypeptide subunit release factors
MYLLDIIQPFDTAAEKYLPLTAPLSAEIIAWAEMHGWDSTDIAHQRLIVRQALLNSILGRLLSQHTSDNVPDNRFVTALDCLDIEAPSALVQAVDEAAQRSGETHPDLWGDLYSALIPQAQRRRIGQFWTQEQIAEWMIAWLCQSNPKCLADVGCGAGMFLRKAAQRLERTSNETVLYGCDISPLLTNLALVAFRAQPGYQESASLTLQVQDYLNTPLPINADAVICNPPYTRHHHIPPAVKDSLYAYFKQRLQLEVPRQATLALYFLLKIIAELPMGGRAAVIVPMEVLDARYGRAAKRILCQYTSLSAIVNFAPQMNAFHKVDVGASILFLQKGYNDRSQVRHLTLNTLPTTEEFLACLDAQQLTTGPLPFGSLMVQPQEALPEAPKWFHIATRRAADAEQQNSQMVIPLKHLVKVVRGIATGANQFFVLPTEEVKRHRLEAFVVRTIQRNREVQSLFLDEERWQNLSAEGKGVWLLYLNGREVSTHPELNAYLQSGESEGYHLRSLVQTRRRWHAMEQRDIPAIFFTILTRGNPRFILNQAGVRPLNMFSLLYPHRSVIEANATELLWALLNSSFSLSRLHSVSRTYGGNTLKVEPRELDNLPVMHPLMLPEDHKQQLRDYISAFYCHQEVSVFTGQVDELVSELLSAEKYEVKKMTTPVQLRLLEEGETYETAAD